MERVEAGSLRGAPAAVGGTPAFPDGLELVRPTIPDPDAVAEDVRRVLVSRQLTNGPRVRELEERVAGSLGVRHCVAVSSCTLGLMLVFRATGLEGSAVLPSFTFAATAHAVAWNGLRPVFGDIDRETLTLSPEVAERIATGDDVAAIVATHTFGTPCDVEGLEALAARLGIPLFLDAAHALGSTHAGTAVGTFGRAEVFSLTPTKIAVAGEGGLIATDDDDLAEACRIGREYANPGDYDSRFVGLNARMSELHAVVALRSLVGLEDRVRRRNELASLYHRLLSDVPGISFPAVRADDVSTYKDLTVLIEPTGFGIDAECLGQALRAEGIDTRRYYAPPVHLHRAYRNVGHGELPVTEWAADRVLTLPLWTEMEEMQIERVVDAVSRIQRHPGVAAACAGRTTGGER